MRASVQKGRHTARHEGPIVVFVIGMRINSVFAVRKWWPVISAMGRMLKELNGGADTGLLASELSWRGWRSPVLIQYWRSFDDVDAYAHDADRAHHPAWRAFNRKIGGDGTVGIFHETFLVEAGGFESVYANMPPFGLASVAGTVPAVASRKDARSRLGRPSHAEAGGR